MLNFPNAPVYLFPPGKLSPKIPNEATFAVSEPEIENRTRTAGAHGSPTEPYGELPCRLYDEDRSLTWVWHAGPAICPGPRITELWNTSSKPEKREGKRQQPSTSTMSHQGRHLYACSCAVGFTPTPPRGPGVPPPPARAGHPALVVRYWGFANFCI